ncbi:cysteine hydrolase [Nitrogeniibacter mangrovi]|uniref:Cysteine hydrolase n=1 Tax=Nitrogeniibacter mangrovi TaxID=2016596 RepID=A0A6C1AZW6_9RHOO|nr:cysteine hydrolase family protein [Nitrogeniibacter mangrovi]QID16279.1 cysteine hydrolase [Nitrogeniibacter mangrovi]
MTKPTTLRNVAGLPDTPPRLADCALVMVDCQQTYREGIMQLDGVEPALNAAAALLGRAREAGCPIFHIQHDAGPGSPYDIRARIGAIAEPVAPVTGEAVITKHLPNAFVGTDLERQIAATGRTDVIVVGFMTHMCINSTARGAFNLGLQPVVVANATATRDLPGADGHVVPAAALQQASLAALGDLFARVLPSADALAV